MTIESTLPLIAILTMAMGLVNCFYGYPIFRFLLAAWGFFIGAGFGLALTQGQDTAVMLLAATVTGLIGAVLAYLAYVVGAFLIGGWLGVVVTGFLLSFANIQTEIVFLAALVISFIVGGFLGVRFKETMIIVSTAFTGAFALVGGGLLLITGQQPESIFAFNPNFTANENLLAMAAWLILGVVGTLTQFSISRRGG